MIANLEALLRFISTCNNALIRDKFNSSLYADRGLAYLLLECYSRAIADFNRAVRLNPTMEIAYFGRGLAHARLKSFEKAVQDYSIAIELHPKFKNAFYHRGSAFSELKRFDKTVADFSRVIQMDLNNAEAFVWRAYAQEKLKQFQAEVDDCTRAIEIKPRFPMAYNNRGYAFWMLGQHSKALADLNKAVELDAFCDIAYVNRAALCHELGKNGKTEDEKKHLLAAIEDFSFLVKNFRRRNMSWTYALRGNCYLELGQLDKAINDTAHALAGNPEDDLMDWTLYVRFRALKEAKLDAQILSESAELIGRNKYLKHVLLARADYFERVEMYVESLADFSRALDLFPTNCRAQYGKARMNFKVNFEHLLFGDEKNATDIAQDN